MARRPRNGFAFRARWAVAGAAALAVLSTSAAPTWSEPVQIRTADHDTFGRLMFFWPSPVNYVTAGNEDRLILQFQRPIHADYDLAHQALGTYLGVVEAAADGHSVVIPLRDGVTARSYPMDNAVIVDLSKTSKGEAEIDLETAAKPEANTSKNPTPSTAPEPTAVEPVVVRVRTGEHPGFTRVVFDWPTSVAYEVSRSGTSTSITFDHPAQVKLGRLQRRPLKYIKRGASATTGGTTTVTLSVPETSKARHFRVGKKVVVDVVGSDAAAARIPVPADAKTVGAVSASPTPTPTPTPMPEAAAQTTEQPSNKNADKPIAKGDDEQPPKTASEPEPVKAAKPKAPPATVTDPPAEDPAPTASNAEKPEAEAAKAANLRFDWDQPVGAAVFRRAGSLWVVFDSPTDQDMTVPAGLEDTTGSMRRVPVQRATALRLNTPETINPQVERDGLAWILRFEEQPLAAPDGIEARIETDDNGTLRLFLPIAEPGDPIAVTDPEVGDNLIVVPVVPLGHGVSRTYTYPQLRLLATGQGVVIQPFVDNLRVRSLPDGIEISVDGDLNVSPVSKRTQAGTRIGDPEELTALLALDPWVGADTVPSRTQRRALERAVIDAGPSEKEKARIDFARFFLAHTYAAEAFGALTLTAQHRPEIADQPQFRALRGVSQLLLGRVNDARDDLFHPSLDGNAEASLWRTAVEATEGQFSRPAVRLGNNTAITRTYPRALRTKLNLLLAEAAIATDQADQATDLMEMLEADVATPSDHSWLEYLKGRYLEAIGDYAGALDTWSHVAEGPDRFTAAKAAMATVELLLRTGEITSAQAAEKLEALRFLWRGDALEVRVLRRLAQLYQENEDYLSGLRTLRQVAGHFSANRQAPEITKQMSETFERLFHDGHADSLPAVSAIALYREFQELTPTGEKGNEMIRKLADRLVDVDLLDDAAALLEKQVRYRLTGVEKAKVGARLAVIHNLNRNPEAAMEVLHVSASGKLPDELSHQRGRLAAEALSALGKQQQALAVLGKDDSLDADLIRANIHWSSEDWAGASQALSRVVRKAGAETGKPLSDRQSKFVLNLAVALTLAGDEDGVARVRKDHAVGMASSPLRDAFHLITGAGSGGNLAGRDWSNQVKQAESFQAYLAVYREQLAHQALSDIN